MPTQKKAIYFLGSLIISFVVGVLFFIVAYNIACAISPPHFLNEETGEKHATMPMGQFFIGILTGTIIGIIALAISYKRFVKIKTFARTNK